MQPVQQILQKQPQNQNRLSPASRLLNKQPNEFSIKKRNHEPAVSQIPAQQDDLIHERAVRISTAYKRSEAELLDVLQEVDTYRVYLKRGHSSLFQYVVTELGISESVAYNLIHICRKARQIPELKEEIKKGNMTLSNARKIVPILTQENKTQWLEKASTLSQRKLEKEISKEHPREATKEKASYVSASRVKLELGLFECDMMKLRQAQDLMSQSQRRAVSLEEVIIAMSNEYLMRHDPVEKAKRQWVKKGWQGQQQESRRGIKEERSTNAPSTLQAHASHQVEADAEEVRERESTGIAGEFLMPAKSLDQPVSRQEGAHPFEREAIPAEILHRIHLRDQRKCTHISSTGKRCNQSR